MSEALLRFTRATLGYGEQPVLSGVDLEVRAGSFVGILGHNGSGKSTLLKTVLGLIPPVEGRVAFAGPRPRLGYVPQKETLDPIYPLTARAVAEMGAGRSEKALVERCLADCGASDLAEKRYSELSGGQKQRVLLARALAAKPELLALDEPLSGIDVTTQRSLIQLLKELKERRKLTVLMVSHRVQAEKDLFTHVVWCDAGKAEMGPAERMLAAGKLGALYD